MRENATCNKAIDIHALIIIFTPEFGAEGMTAS